MTTSLDTLLSYQSIDLHPFEIRGAKSGINNGQSTGPVFVDGTYIPARNAITGSGFFDRTDSSKVSNILIDAPYAFMTANDLRVSDTFVASIDAPYTIKSIVDATSFYVDRNFDMTGSFPMTFTLGSREYLVEPDVGNNDFFATADFTNSSTSVTGHGTLWTSEMVPGDIIKHNAYQKYFKIKSIEDDTHLTLSIGYDGDTTSGPCTAKKSIIGDETIQYVRNNFTYDNQGGRWKYDATTGSDGTTSLSFAPLADGVELAFTSTISPPLPDIMDTAQVLNKVFSKSTQYDTHQYPLPVVPFPETVRLYINDIEKFQYPLGTKDFVLSYSQNPLYETPPPVTQRKVCNVMFLNSIQNRTLNPLDTEEGHILFLDKDGKNVNEIFSDSAEIQIDSTAIIPYEDYVLEPYSGFAETVDYDTNEHIVKYVSVSQSSLINLGLKIYLNDQPQKISEPPSTTDDVVFQPRTGRLKPAKQDKPGPKDTYRVFYQVEGDAVYNEKVADIPVGTTFLKTQLWPIEQNSVMVLKNGIVINEGVDFSVSYQSGRILLNTPTALGDVFTLSYTPLSEQVNDLSYSNSNWYCTANNTYTAHGDNFTFYLTNQNLDPTDSSNHFQLLRVYNATRNKTYDTTGVKYFNRGFYLASDASNTAIGIGITDQVFADYKFLHETLEYAPAVYNRFEVTADTSQVKFEGVDATSIFIPGCVLRMDSPDTASSYNYAIQSCSCDGTDTLVNILGTMHEDLTNPAVYVSDAPVSFLPINVAMEPLVAGSNIIAFLNINIRRYFRPNTLIKIGTDVYLVANSSYNRYATIVHIAGQVTKDYLDPVILSSAQYSDCPVYLEGETEITPAETLISLPGTPGMILCQRNTDIIPIFSDSTHLYVGSYIYDFNTYPTLGDITGAIHDTTGLNIDTWIASSSWRSKEIKSFDSTRYLYTDSSTIIEVNPELRLDGTSTTAFEVTPHGTVSLSNGLIKNQRYDLDYMGRRFIGDGTVSFSTNYFVNLPAKSKVSASFEFSNLDQFYIQVLSQRDFFESVTIPRMQQETPQLNGNVGQGGTVYGDEDSGNSSGGMANDFYKLKDDQIECRVFKNIYDFFSIRLEAYGNEMYAAEGYKLFNNDGIFREDQQAVATNPGNNTRIFPDAAYSKFPPQRVNPLTGEFISFGAVFTKDSTVVTGHNTNWSLQLSHGDYIGRYLSDKRYKINTVSNNQIILNSDSTFSESSTKDTNQGEWYTASTVYPIYDDDGNLGAKIIGSKSENFYLDPLGTDTFDCYIDGTHVSHTFTTPTDPVMALLLNPYFLNAGTIASLLTNDFNKQLGKQWFQATVESVLDVDTLWKRTAIVLRTLTPANSILIGGGSAVIKLGFVPNTYSAGNLNPAQSLPEVVLLAQEAYHLGQSAAPLNEFVDLTNIIGIGTPNKLDRLNPSSLASADDLYTQVQTEIGIVNLEVDRLVTEINSVSHILQEPAITSSYAHAQVALVNATDMLSKTLITQGYDSNIYPSWEGKSSDWAWVLDYTSSRQIILGTDSSKIATDQTTGSDFTSINGQNSFILQVPSDYDFRVLNTTVHGNDSTPILKTLIGNYVIDGTWTGWDSSVSGYYSADNTVMFSMNTAPNLFYINRDTTAPAPQYQTSSNSLSLKWNEDEGPQTLSFLYTDYTSVQLLAAAIDAVPGFGVTSIVKTDYTYSNLKVTTASLPLAPGVNVYTGTNSPALSLQYQSYYKSEAAHMTLDGTRLNANSYSSMQNYVTAMNNIHGYNVISFFAPDYHAPAFIDASGSVDFITGTNIFFNEDVPVINLTFRPKLNPHYRCDTTALRIYWDDKIAINQSVEILYAAYPLVGDIVNRISQITGFMAYAIAPIYNAYGSLKPANQFITSPVTFYDTLNTPLFSVSFGMSGATWNGLPDHLELNYLDGTRPVTIVKNYASYLNLGNLTSAIQAETYFDGSLIYNSAPYIYNSLHIGSSVPITTPLYLAPNSIALKVVAASPTYSASGTSLSITYSGGSPLVYPYSSYVSLHTLQTAVGLLPGITVGNFFTPDCTYNTLQASSGTIGITSPSILNFGSDISLFKTFFDMTNPGYFIDSTGLNVYWVENLTTTRKVFSYDLYPTIGSVKAGLNAMPTINAFGPSSLDASSSTSFKQDSGIILVTPDSTIYPGLKPCYAVYQTISDRLLDTRMSFITDRSSQMVPRITYLDDVRFSQIENDIRNEQILRSDTGGFGDLWIWANNRFNRRQGCEAKLKQQEQLIASNQTALAINKSLM
jgi:hypothetical protein